MACRWPGAGRRRPARLYPPGATDPVRRAGGVLARTALVDARLPRLPDGRPAPRARGRYENNNGFTQGLQAVARLARMDGVGLRVACIDHASWDTHDAQPGRFNALVGTLVPGWRPSTRTHGPPPGSPSARW